MSEDKKIENVKAVELSDDILKGVTGGHDYWAQVTTCPACGRESLRTNFGNTNCCMCGYVEKD